MYDPLSRVNEEGELTYYLAESYEQTGDLERARALPGGNGRYIVVNAAAQRLFARALEQGVERHAEALHLFATIAFVLLSQTAMAEIREIRVCAPEQDRQEHERFPDQTEARLSAARWLAWRSCRGGAHAVHFTHPRGISFCSSFRFATLRTYNLPST